MTEQTTKNMNPTECRGEGQALLDEKNMRKSGLSPKWTMPKDEMNT